MRFKLLVLLLLFSELAQADWTGVSVNIANLESDWKFDSAVREAQIDSIDFRIEEKTATGLSVGFGIGFFSMRLKGDSVTDSSKFDGEYLNIYLRQRIPVGKTFSLFGSMSYRYNTGNDDGGDDVDDRADIDWSETNFQVGVSARIANFRVTPFAAYYHIDGDISDDNGTEVFEMDDPESQGIQLDYYLEDTAFIRLVIQSGSQAGGYLTFARRY